jgi:membrane-associated protease RseP (regulator of RpoE activity)
MDARRASWGFALGLLACRPSDATDTERAEASASSVAAAAPSSSDEPSGVASPDLEQAAWRSAVERAVERGIVDSGADDATLRVDPFVAVLLFEVLQDTRGAPVFTAIEPREDPAGPAGGYRVGRLEDGSVYHRLGLREGDIVESINGVVLSSADRFDFALDGAENRVRLTVYRDGYLLTLSYHLTGGLGWAHLLAGLGGSVVPEVAPPDVVWQGEDAGRDSNVARGSAAEPSAVPASPPTAGAGRTAAPKPSARPTAPATAPARSSHASCESASKCTVAKSHFDELIAAPDRLRTQADVVPAIRNDVHSGYRLKTVRPGSTVAALGFRSGDKVTHVNGYDLSNDAQALQLYFALAGSRIFKVRYERGTQHLMKTIVVQ